MQLEFILRYIVSIEERKEKEKRYIVSIEERKEKRYIVSSSPIVSRSFGFPPRVAYTRWESMGVDKLSYAGWGDVGFTDCWLFPQNDFLLLSSQTRFST